jgi:hypothetical protein
MNVQHALPSLRHLVVAFGVTALLAACGGGGGGGGSSTPPPSEPPPANPQCEEGTQFTSTFEAIQKVIFEKRGCTQDVCHGSAAQGGLNLSPDVAYENIFEKPSVSSRFPLITPGDRTRSYLFHKVSAATDPGSFEIAGAPMPNGLEPLTPNELEALRMWIYAGAPETGTVGGTEQLLDACLPEPKPITIEPLDPPAPGEGFQFVMPQWDLPAKSEHELCFATYYDITDQVPAEFQNNGMFRFKGFELRQDPQSHHLILYYPSENFRPEGVDVTDPSFGAWTCAGGERHGEACEPTDLSSCGSGLCRSEPKPTFACIGYGPSQGAPIPVGGAQQAQAYNLFLDGVFAQLPMKGVLYWNSHAFNLTDEDTVMNGRLNYLFAENQRYPVNNIFNASRIFAANAAPYTEQTVCNDHVLPRGARLFELTSHTHQRGKHFTVDLPDGSRIYESFVYNDPVRQQFDPPLAFDSPDPKDRTLRYCSLFNNGVNEDGSPNPETVTRASRVPISASQTIGRCTPIACVAGKIGAACNGADDDASCDSSPGAGDGDCDACRITGGESTENEMFILFGTFYIDPAAGAAGDGIARAQAVSAVDANGRSLWSEPATPGHMGCSATGHMAHGASADDDPNAVHAAHAGHAGH